MEMASVFKAGTTGTSTSDGLPEVIGETEKSKDEAKPLNRSTVISLAPLIFDHFTGRVKLQ